MRLWVSKYVYHAGLMHTISDVSAAQGGIGGDATITVSGSGFG